MGNPAAGEAAEAHPPGAGASGQPVHDVLVAVPFRHRLSTKLLGLSAVLALAALAGLWFAERRMQRDLVDQLARSTSLLADAIQTSAQEEMLAARPGHAWRVMDLVGRLDGVERVRVLDKAGRVIFSTEPADVGSIVEKSGRGCAACHGGRAQPLSRAPPGDRAEVLATDSGRTLAMIAPVYNAQGCTTAQCHVHPHGRQVLGLLDVRVSLGSLDADVLAFRRGFVLVVAAAVLVLAALLYLFFRAEVVEPVAALLEGTHRVARDDLDVEIRVRSTGELGLLATSFNDMTRSLRRLEDALNAMMNGLEQEVELRTADLQDAQEQLVRTEKLSSLGKLSASIAHEINNPLAGILTFAKLVSRTLAEGPPDDARRATLQRNLALIERETQRCSAIVKNLLDFARERPMQQKALDARGPLDEALSLIGNQFQTHGIEIVRDLAAVPDVHADFGQLRQAFVNIAINACEAMGSSGRLSVSTRLVRDTVEIAFADTGPGIPPERLSKIFDPFFTTKEKGTGLGLSVVYGIVERHGGVVSVESEAGKGTTFTIRLPVAAAQPADGAAGQRAAVS
jgi:two-component system NtrC family sensor kinase